MMKDTVKTNLILFKLGEFTELVSTMNSYENNSNISNLILDDIDEVKDSLNENSNGVLLFSVKTKSDFQALVALFKQYNTEIKSGKLKLALIQIKKNYKIEAILRKFGCNEFLDSDINQKSLRFKVDFWARGILKNLEKEIQKELSYSKREASKKSNANLAEVKRANFKDIESLKEEVDIWISKENNCKKVLSKWLISMYGPSPHVAHWESCGNDTWKFLINDESKNSFYEPQGHWYFVGLKPEFNWKDKLWGFSSQDARLYFKGEDIECERLYVKEHTLYISQNSKYANLLKTKILDSAQSSFNIERAKQKEIEEEKRFKDEETKKEYMEGESSTDHIDGYMSGKTEGEDKLEDLSGQLKKLEKKHEDLKNKMKNASGKEAKDLAGQIKEIEAKKNSLQGEIKENLEKKYEDLKSKMKNASGKEAKDLAGQIKEIEKKKSSLGGKIKKTEQESDKKAEDLEKTSKDEVESKKKKDRLKAILEKEVNSNKSSSARDSKDINASSMLQSKEEDEEESYEDRADTLSQDASVIVRLASQENNAVYLCQLEDLQEELLYVSYKSLNLPQNENYKITLTMDYGAKKVSISTNGKIKELEEEIYCLDIDRIETSALNKFMELYEERQSNIFEFLKMARGF